MRLTIGVRRRYSLAHIVSSRINRVHIWWVLAEISIDGNVAGDSTTFAWFDCAEERARSGG